MGERMMTSKHVQELAAVTRPCTGNSNEGKCTSDANATVQPKNVASNISLRVVAAAADIGKVEMSTWNAIKAWFGKMRGGIAKHPPSPPPTDMLLAGVGAFVGLLAVAALNARFVGVVDLPMLLGCFGASATLLFGMPALPVAQPRNVFGGTIISSVAGLLWRTLLGNHVWIAAPLAVATAIVGMQATATLHPPGGAAALIIAVMEPLQSVHPVIIANTFLGSDTGAWCLRHTLANDMRERFIYGLVLMLGTILGSFVLFAIALFTNNIGPSKKRYPTYWWA